MRSQFHTRNSDLPLLQIDRPALFSQLSILEISKPYKLDVFEAKIDHAILQEVSDLAVQDYINPESTWDRMTLELASRGGFFDRLSVELLEQRLACPQTKLVTLRFSEDPQQRLAGFMLINLDGRSAHDSHRVPTIIQNDSYKFGRVLICVAGWAKQFAKQLELPSPYDSLSRIALDEGEKASLHFFLGKVICLPAAKRAIQIHKKQLNWQALEKYQLEYLHGSNGKPIKVVMYHWGIVPIDQEVSSYLLDLLPETCTPEIGMFSLTAVACRDNKGTLDRFYAFDNKANNGCGAFVQYEGATIENGELFVAHAFKKGYFFDPHLKQRRARFREFDGKWLFDEVEAKSIAKANQFRFEGNGIIPHHCCLEKPVTGKIVTWKRERIVP